MILEDLYPAASEAGMTKEEFFHSAPNDIFLRIESYRKNLEMSVKTSEYESWLTGAFTRAAVGSLFSKNGKYPENPVAKEQKTNRQDAPVKKLSEEEIQQNLRYWTLRVEQANAIIQNAGRQGE